MESEQRKGVMRAAIIGSVVVALILIAGTFWSGKSAGSDTEQAVRNVSLLYLDELAGRREQVVSSAFGDYIRNMTIALSLLTKDDLSSVEKFQAYQSKIKKIYGFEKFAFVADDGLIYTSMGTRNDIEVYNLDYKNLTDATIILKNLYGQSKKLVIALPVDNLPFNGKTLVACFMELNITSMLEYVCMQDTGNTTLCNIYTADGISLTNVVLGGMAGGSNIFKELESAKFEKNYSIGEMKRDFAESRKGYISFRYENVKGTLYYVPIHGVNWFLTYFIRESIIDDQVSAISSGIMQRNLTQTILTTIVLVGVFGMMITQFRRAAKINLEKEISETENRVKQQELEEQLALQEELLAQEQLKVQQDNMINALSADYRSVYYVNLNEDSGVCYREDEGLENAKAKGEKFKFSDAFTTYATKYVVEEYRIGFLAFIKPENIRAALKKESIITYRYLTRHGDKESYEKLRMANVKNSDDPNIQINEIGMGFTDIDEEMRDALAKNQVLNDALKTAEEASTAKTVFLSNMSHEIRTPMNAIIGLDNLALNVPDLPEKAKDYLKKIDSSAQHLLGLINDILDMSRIESGRMSLKNEEFSFSELIEQINTMFGGQCHEKKLTYNCRINGAVDDFYIGDDMKLKQVLINILGNAVKFTPEGGTIDFIVEKTANFGGKSTFKFMIKDTGVGMSKDFLPKIFDTFSQENSNAVNKYGSSGLGMPITKNIVEMMNGNISVESEKGVGTTFFVTVTLTDSEKKEAFDDDIEINPLTMHVLIIDDDPIACDHAKLVLEKIGIAAEAATSGKDALEMIKLKSARREPYNLIIVDWQMPEMDGVEVTRQIRSILGDETSIIILTAYNWDDISGAALSAGVDSFIAKPLFSGQLLQEFKNALKKKKALTPVTTQKADLTGRKVLLAEDMIVNAEIMMEVLKMRDIEPEHAENGKIAVEMFEKSPVGYYAAVLMDMRMPEMDGLQATQAIRALNRADAKTVPIIALTANAFDEDVQRSLQSGLNAHLSKPVNPDVLFDTLENLVK